jgi:hypothetical protein
VADVSVTAGGGFLPIMFEADDRDYRSTIRFAIFVSTAFKEIP